MPRSNTPSPRWALVLVLGLMSSGCQGWTNPAEQQQAARVEQLSRWGTPSVFTPANRTFGEGVRSHFGLRPEPTQPFPFTHKVHLEKELACTDCHEGVERGPRAGLPSINTCMTCHQAIATEKPLIQQLAAMHEKGLDLPWQRVYDYTREAHVRFDHAPHIRNKVECSTCHGNQAAQTVAVRAVNMDMAFCVNCHKQKQASNDCLTCHY